MARDCKESEKKKKNVSHKQLEQRERKSVSAVTFTPKKEEGKKKKAKEKTRPKFFDGPAASLSLDSSSTAFVCRRWIKYPTLSPK